MYNKSFNFLLSSLILSLPFERLLTFDVAGFTVKLSYIIGFILLVVSIPALIGQIRKIKLDLAEISLLIFVLISLLSVFWSIDRERTLFISLLYLFMAGIFFVIKRFAAFERIERYTDLFIYIGVVLSVFALWQFISDSFYFLDQYSFLRDEYKKGVFSFPRVQATFLEPLFFANFMIIPFFLSVSKALKSRALKEYTFLFLIMTAIILTLSRGASLALVVGIIIFVILGISVMKLRIKLFIPVAVAIILAVLLSAGLIFLASGNKGLNSYANQALNTSDVTTSSQVSNLEYLRTRNFTVATAEAESGKHIMGVGVGAFGSLPYFQPLLDLGRHQTVNNEYLEILVEGGALSLIAIIAFFVTMLIIILKRIISDKDLLDLAFLSIVIAVLCQYLAFSNLYLIYLWVFFGLILSKRSKVTT